VTYAVLYFVQISRVVGDSMNPTYKNGNIVLVNKKFYSYSDVKYGDVVVAKANFGDGEEQIIKRVIGKGGDVLACKSGVMYRNGKKLNETYIKEKMFDDNWTVTVKKGCLFCMGDNRNNSADSREIGSINFKTNIVGKVFFKVF
jgi:signal peptidase I